MLIPSAFAQSPSLGGDAGLMGFLPIIIMFVVLYFLMIRERSSAGSPTARPPMA